jgi:c-di-GMP-binding flagellar brake protein YcgR
MQELSIVERRNYTRHEVIVPTRYWVHDERDAIPCDVLDISLGGMCVELPSWAWVDPGAYATVELPVPGGLTQATTPVRVTAVTGGDTRRVHMRFLDTSPVFHGLLQAATETWQARAYE